MIAFSLLFSWYFLCSFVHPLLGLPAHSPAIQLQLIWPISCHLLLLCPSRCRLSSFFFGVCVCRQQRPSSPFFLFLPSRFANSLYDTHTHTTDKLFDSEEKTVRQGMIALARVTDDSQNKGAERAAATAATKEIYAN